MPLDIGLMGRINRILQNHLKENPEIEEVVPESAVVILAQKGIDITAKHLRDLLRDQRHRPKKIIQGAWQDSSRRWHICRDGDKPS